MSASRGHVFVIRGDVQHLACDVYLVSTDRALRREGKWLKAIPDAAERVDSLERAAFQSEERFTLPVYVTDRDSREATPLLVAVPYEGTRRADQLVPRIREFFDVAARLIQIRRVSFGDRPLVALPMFAVDAGGGGPVRGEILRVLYDESRSASARFGFDIAITLRDPRAYDLAQVMRRSHHDAWPDLSTDQLEHARALGTQAADEKLVPFMGAGISMTAGSPSWKGLIIELGRQAGLSASEAEALAASGHDALDQAAYIALLYERAAPSEQHAFAQAIISAVDKKRYGLAPPLLAALRAEQAITLNYDELFEIAAADGGVPRRVIPGKASAAERWLLKLHGTVTDPSSIVLTREHYLGFDSDKAVLNSLAKATLMTRKLLFVGFGMSDPHFHEIVHDVRGALPKGVSSFGTVLTLSDDPITRRLWRGDLEFITLPSGRMIDIFLDAVLAHASTARSYVLARGYTSALPRGDAKLARAVHHMINSLDPEALASESWLELSAHLRALGWDESDRHDLRGSRPSA